MHYIHFIILITDPFKITDYKNYKIPVSACVLCLLLGASDAHLTFTIPHSSMCEGSKFSETKIYYKKAIF